MGQTLTDPQHTAVTGPISVVLFTVIYLSALPLNFPFPGNLFQPMNRPSMICSCAAFLRTLFLSYANYHQHILCIIHKIIVRIVLNFI